MTTKLSFGKDIFPLFLRYIKKNEIIAKNLAETKIFTHYQTNHCFQSLQLKILDTIKTNVQKIHTT